MRFYCPVIRNGGSYCLHFGLQLLGFLFQVPSVPEELFFAADESQERFVRDAVTSAQALVS